MTTEHDTTDPQTSTASTATPAATHPALHLTPLIAALPLGPRAGVELREPFHRNHYVELGVWAAREEGSPRRLTVSLRRREVLELAHHLLGIALDEPHTSPATPDAAPARPGCAGQARRRHHEPDPVRAPGAPPASFVAVVQAAKEGP